MSAKPKITAITIAAIVAMSVVASSVRAQPSEEIRRAVAASGAPSVSAASPDAFLHAFSSVLVRTRGTDVPAYVSAAVSMRPDLAPQITVAALRSHRTGGKEIIEKQVSCDWVDPIIRAAILAAPSARDAIVQAAIAAEPYARECIIAAAGAPPAEAFLRPPGIDVGNVNGSIAGTINPANLGQGGIISPEHH